MTRNQMIKTLDAIADAMMTGKPLNLKMADDLLVIRHYLMSGAERGKEERNLSKWAGELGAKGGAAKTAAKRKASVENGKLGGRPRKERKDQK